MESSNSCVQDQVRVLRRCNQRQYDLIRRLEGVVSLAFRAIRTRDPSAERAFLTELDRWPLNALGDQAIRGVDFEVARVVGGDAE